MCTQNHDKKLQFFCRENEMKRDRTNNHSMETHKIPEKIIWVNEIIKVCITA